MTQLRLTDLHDPRTKPAWAALSRLAGDRAAILFEELRLQLAKIDGLREELFYHGPEWGWGPRYSAGGRVLFSARIRPGKLEVTMELDAAEREKLLASKQLGARVKEAIRSLTPGEGVARGSLPLLNRSDVRSIANLIVLRHQLLASFEKSAIRKAARR